MILYSLLTDGIVLVFVERWGKNESRGESTYQISVGSGYLKA